MHRISLPGLLLLASLLLMASVAFAQSDPCNVMGLGPIGSFNGFVPFPSNSLWNTNISSAQVDPNSANYIASSAGARRCIPISAPGCTMDRPSASPTLWYPARSRSQDHLHLVWRRKRSRPHADPINALIEGFPEPGQWRPACADRGQGQLLAVRAVLRVQCRPTGLECWLGCGVGPGSQRDTSVHLDIGRCSGTADSARTGARTTRCRRERSIMRFA